MPIKYRTLADLRDAYLAKELTVPLIIDHGYDGAEVFLPDDLHGDTGTTVFEMDTCDLIRQALDLLQIPNEHG